MNLNHNIVIEASAGTGKTYTLVHTILQALFEKNLPMESLVAMTFTKKAAGEMKERIAAKLQEIDQAETLHESWKAWGHSLTDLKTQARKALETIDRAAIGTIHSYAFSLLKRFPLAAGINPSAEVDEKGVRTDDLFEREWPLWLQRELQAHRRTEREAAWLKVFEKVSVAQIGDLTRRLCEFDVPLDVLPLKDPEEDATLILITQMVKPFVAAFRAKILAEGFLSNDALLILARELVHRDLKVRESLKQQIRLIFVDEFQDTDPLQGELILFLSELPGTSAKSWDKVKLEPGKLFIVGDPKQSIYRFRGADIAAYKRITEMVLEQGGIRHSLDQSYRSHEQIIHVVNAAFTALMQEKPPISPAYQTLIPRRAKEDPERQDVEMRLATSDQPQSSDEAVEKEAADAARWVEEAKIQKRWTYKDVAFVFRSTVSMSTFVEALRQRHIPFVVEAERYFYRTPEVTDVLNLLRILEDPHNRIALVGFLRSPLGGFTDVELALLQSKNGIQLNKPLPAELQAAAHRGAWELLHRLHARAGREPLKSILNHVYTDTYLLELAARSYHRDQTIANLLKLKRLMESFAEEGETTLTGLMNKIDRFMEEDRLEGEYPLADETYDAVRLLTVHKAKGLEFPVVWLPGLHRGRGSHRTSNRIAVRYDWASDRLAITVGKDLKSLHWDTLEEDVKLRDTAEELRVLYVAMTRAREHLILSGGVNLKRPNKDSFLAQLAGAWKLDLKDLPEGVFKAGEGNFTVRPIESLAKPTAEKNPDSSRWLKNLDLVQLAKTWKEREQKRLELAELRIVKTPSHLSAALKKSEKPKPVTTPAREPINPTLLGTLVHLFLERWDFQCEKCSMPLALRHAANSLFSGLGLLKSPFPDPKEAESPQDNPRELTLIVDEAQRLLADFIGSEEEEEIKGSTILGREVPFFYEDGDALMRGALDILYRLPSGQWMIGDYKTDREQDETRYAAQAAAYTEAVARALGEKAIFKTIYIRQVLQSSHG